ncbi:MAG: CheF family chemotaxis protein [Haloferacaceae archaeon]
MSEGEHKLADTKGKFAQVVKNERKLSDAAWTAGRIILSNRRLVLAGSGGKRQLPLSEIEGIGGRFDLNQEIARVSDYIALRLGDGVVLVAPKDRETFDTKLFRALLDQEMVLAKHPAVEGGVVQDTEWHKSRLKVEEESLALAMADGTFVEMELDEVGQVDESERTVIDEKRQVVEVAHVEDGTSVQTYVAGPPRRCSFVETLLGRGAERNQASLDLSETEKEVLMALYSGVSPFEIPEFVGMDVETVEETFDRLVDLEVLEEVRKRREVALTTRGRNLASESISEQ